MRVVSLRHRVVGLVAAAVAATFASSPSVLAQAKDDLWEVTTKMEMPGMPMAMPAQVNRVCVAKERKDEDLIPRRDNCRVLESKRVGSRLTYKMACTGAEPMDIAGEMTLGGNGYEGRMRMTSTSGGQSMEMAQTFAGRRVGDCVATK
ncbi:MAG TPA: DUF3617 family protein [Casimicrobiaceae bacterium]